MHERVLDLLRCPFCGTRLSLVENDALLRVGDRIESGVLGCECCAFPVVAGIPVMIANDATRDAMHALERGERETALLTLLGVDDTRRERFRAFLARGKHATYREGLDILSHDAEGTCFLYRFSDPTFVLAESLVRAIGADRRRTSHVIDLCGGSGHLTRVLSELSGSRVVVADVFYWKLWLAQRFTAPGCAPVCCDANHPLPFKQESFSLVVLSDAFPYIWHKRLLAGEMMRLASEKGTILMPHLHSSLGFNFSAGMTLTPAAYCDLFTPARPWLFRDSDLLNDILGHTAIDLSRGVTPEQAGDEPSVTLVASRDGQVFRKHALADPDTLTGELRVNPLYRVEQNGAQAALTLTFPTPEYEEEFGGGCRRYLPETVTVDADLTGRFVPATLGTAYEELRRRRIVIDAPAR